ncbi:DUF4279 domain-containing protein [Nonomuraea sp. NPDC059194]|uniref:DUF4279 domain-containing protein n=1 Tax=Nonomuraea sp. NPDC059194 TaxID=3346764 RepID=UPI0036A6C27D
MSNTLTTAEISEVVGLRSSPDTRPGEWMLDASSEGDKASLDDQIMAVIGPVLGSADRLSALTRDGAEVELHLTRSLFGLGNGALCFMLDSPVIKFLADVGASVWFDEYDEITWGLDDRTPPA